MRFVLLADTHEQHNDVRVPDGDVLIHAGDITYRGNYDKVRDALDWMAGLPHRHKILVAGNHDFLFEKHADQAAELIAGYPVTYLQDSGAMISDAQSDFEIYGSPWQPRFCDWAFNANQMQRQRIWSQIPITTNILITHGPPYGILDNTVMSGHAGCEELRREVFQRVRPQLHVFGHIHGSYGKENYEGMTFCNASVVDEAYNVVNDPWVLDL